VDVLVGRAAPENPRDRHGPPGAGVCSRNHNVMRGCGPGTPVPGTHFRRARRLRDLRWLLTSQREVCKHQRAGRTLCGGGTVLLLRGSGLQSVGFQAVQTASPCHCAPALPLSKKSLLSSFNA
jgi:hypothetical protein